MNKWLTGIVFLLISNFSFGGDVKPEVETSPGFYRVIKSGDVLVNADGIPYTVFNVTNIPSYYVTNNSYGINFGSLTVQGHSVLTNETYGILAYNKVNSLPTNNWNWVVTSWSNSPAYSITLGDISGWSQSSSSALYASNTAFAVSNMVTLMPTSSWNWVVSSWSNSSAYKITSADTSKWNWVSLDWSNSVARTITSIDTSKWNWAANNWSNSIAYKITSTDTSKWNWVVSSWSNSAAYNITTNSMTNWNDAYNLSISAYQSTGGLINGNAQIQGDLNINGILSVSNGLTLGGNNVLTNEPLAIINDQWISDNSYNISAATNWINVNSDSILNGTQYWNKAWSWVNANSNNAIFNYSVSAPTGSFTSLIVNGFDTSIVYTNSYIVGVTNTSTTNFTMTGFNFPSIHIVRGRMYVADTNNAASGFSRSNTVTFCDRPNDGQGSEYWQADMYLSSQFINSNMNAGVTNVYLVDITSMTNNVLVYLNGFGGSNEFVRIHKTAPLSNNLILKGTNLYPHISGTNCFNRVAEFSSFRTFNIYGSNVVYGTFDFGPTFTTTTVNIKLDIEYTK